MPKINVLEKNVAELIAAGEVVERPASVIKELVENAIDAGSTRITVEIQRGGVAYMRITDNGCGISAADVPLAFLRHATSKIKNAEDLDGIATLGFRGEALAATCAVARVELLTKTAEEEVGTHFGIEGGQQTFCEESGCPDGTTIIVRELFYNTPARMKFLKKDVSEGNAVAAVLDRVALSHPEIAFKLIRDGKPTLNTPGDGKLESAVYSVLGREFAKSVLPVSGESGGISVAGVTVRPISCRQARSHQFVFLNGRFVHSGTVTAAVEQAYKNSAMIGKFPAFVLNVSVPYGAVDVNVHPAKTEVRFSDERRIFDAVYYAIKNALAGGDTRPVLEVASKHKPAAFSNISVQEYRQEVLKTTPSVPAAQPVQSVTRPVTPPPVTAAPPQRLQDDGIPYFMRKDIMIERDLLTEKPSATPPAEETKPVEEKTPIEPPAPVPPTPTEPEIPLVEEEPVRVAREAFKAYIIAEKGDSIYLIDKHAAHERILFEEMKKNRTVEVQNLLTPVRVRLGREEYDAVLSSIELLQDAGFETEDFGNGTVLVRAIPAPLAGTDVVAVLQEVADSLLVRGSVQVERLDRIYHTVACKAATKAGYHSADGELLTLAKRILADRDIMYCPHGRPVAFEIRKSDLEKYFGRIQ
ncbi:MAG: DNA mismatch repair endonuclease MutL [Clostridia bacterium]|nr:DNA mismatch repair endonuclease MutL [Clostridia bacterium]